METVKKNSYLGGQINTGECDTGITSRVVFRWVKDQFNVRQMKDAWWEANSEELQNDADQHAAKVFCCPEGSLWRFYHISSPQFMLMMELC